MSQDRPSLAPCPMPFDPSRSPSLKRAGIAAASAALLTLAGCGGGGGGGGFFPTSAAPPPAVAPAPAPAPAAAAPGTVTGTAATGAAFAGAHLTAIDKTGATVCDTTVSDTGIYTCQLPSTTQPPLVISALKDDIGLYSMKADAKDGTVNVTPITTILASRLAPDGNPASLSAAMQSNPSILDAAKIEDQVKQVLAFLKPLLDALGDTVDPLSGSFAADGSGHDRALDTLSVSVRPNGTVANIEVTVKTIPSSETAPPTAVTFRSTDATLPTLPAIAANTLPAGDASADLIALMAKTTNCFALPLSQRVNAANDTTAVTGTAADVKPACREMFFSGDPATYLNYGSRVGRDASNRGSFSGLFRPGATGVKFQFREIGYYLPNGDVLFTFETIDTLGNVTMNNTTARRSGDALLLMGNQQAYSAGVSPAVQQRDFINAPAYSYYNVGYDISIANVTDTNGNPLLARVDVVAPDGASFRFVPTAGSNNLRLQRPNGTTSGTSIVRLNAAFRNAGTAGHPTTLANESLYYVSPLLTDDQIGHLPDNGVWTFQIVPLTGPTVTQYTRTLRRTMTLAEAAQVKFAGVSDVSRTYFANLTGGYGYFTFLTAPSTTNPNYIQLGTTQADYWQVPAGAVAPTQITVFGSAPPVNGVAGAAFDDSATVASSARIATIFCSPATAQDAHCNSTTGVTQYAQGASVNYTQLLSTNASLLEYFSGIAFYYPQ